MGSPKHRREKILKSAVIGDTKYERGKILAGNKCWSSF